MRNYFIDEGFANRVMELVYSCLLETGSFPNSMAGLKVKKHEDDGTFTIVFITKGGDLVDVSEHTLKFATSY